MDQPLPSPVERGMDLERIEREHVRGGGAFCECCFVDWPCLPATLIARVRQLEEALRVIAGQECESDNIAERRIARAALMGEEKG